MKVSFIVPCRDKAFFVERAAISVLRQDYSPMELVFSDQGSTDGTYEILERVTRSYNGPNTVRLVKCPHTERRGMAGLNVHLNWLQDQIEGDIVIMASADDLNHPSRARMTVDAFAEHNPSYVATAIVFCEPNGDAIGLTAFPDTSRFVTGIEHIQYLVGSSSSPAWSRELLYKYPLAGIESEDVVIPFFATLERGLYYLNLPLYHYIRHNGAGNTGLEGVFRSAESDEEKTIGREMISYHLSSMWFSILARIKVMGIAIDEEMQSALGYKAFEAAASWAMARDKLTFERWQPRMMKA